MLSCDVRLTVSDHILAAGRVPSLAQLAERLAMPPDDLARELRRLQDLHALALVPASDEILMAHPFSAVPTSHVVHARAQTFWANCAWDAPSIPPLLGVDGDIETRCGDCGQLLTFRVTAGHLQPQAAVVHYAVPPRRFWQNVAYT